MSGDMTFDAVRQICKETGGYNTASLNEKLYLHFKGWPRIENLEEFTGARVVWLEGNGLTKIEGLDACKGLRQIYLQQNCIQNIENLDDFPELRALNLSENFIKTIQGLQGCPNVETLQLNQCNITDLSDLEHLRECKSICCLELSKNRIEDPALLDILESLPMLKVLKLDGNPVVRKIKQYRKTLICRLKKLTYLDDRPVFEEEREVAEAFGRGGLEAEKMERQRQRDRKREAAERNHKAFFKMVEEGKRERRAREKAEAERKAREPVKVAEEEPTQATTFREKGQEELLNNLEADSTIGTRKPRSRKREDGKRRTKCSIKEVAGGDATQPNKGRTKVVVQEVDVNDEAPLIKTPGQPVWSLPPEDSTNAPTAAVPETAKSRRSATRSDRKARLKAAMAAVDAERGGDGVRGEESVPRFAQLSEHEIEMKLVEDANATVMEEVAEDEDAELLAPPAVGNSESPAIYGTKQYDELWAKASSIAPELVDDEVGIGAVGSLVEDDSTMVCDIEELD